MSKVKIAFIGCGYIVEIHLNHLMSFNDVEIVGFYSSNIEKSKKLSEKAGQGKAYENFIEMYDTARPDGVYICTIPSAHGDFELEAIQRGIHIFVEKPIGLEVDVAEKIAADASKNGIVTCVGYQERYLDIIDRAKEYLKGRKIGLVQGAWLGGIPGAYWWRQKGKSGGQIVEQSTHIFDMLRYLIGEPESVYCKGGAGIIEDLPDYDIEDYSSTIITFKNGIIANVFTGCYLHDGLEPHNGITFYTSDAVIDYHLRKSVKICRSNSKEEYYVVSDGFKAINRTFIDAIQSGNKSEIRSDYADSLKTLKLTLACNKSIETGLPVTVS